MRIPITELALKPGKTAVIVGAQWGDEGKGKIVDVLSESFSVVARYAGTRLGRQELDGNE